MITVEILFYFSFRMPTGRRVPFAAKRQEYLFALVQALRGIAIMISCALPCHHG